jgi:hypothetical protein
MKDGADAVYYPFFALFFLQYIVVVGPQMSLSVLYESKKYNYIVPLISRSPSCFLPEGGYAHLVRFQFNTIPDMADV